MRENFEGAPFDTDDEALNSRSDSAMTLWEHIEELRWVLVKTLVAFTLFTVLIALLLFPFKGVLDLPLTRGLAMAGIDQELVLRTAGPVEPFAVMFQIVFFGAIALTLPFALYFLAQFVAPGLTEKERRILRPSCLAILGLFLLGAAFSYVFVLPMTIFASFWMHGQLNFVPLWSPTMYYGTVVWMTLGLGMLFEFPLILLLLQYLGILTTRHLQLGRRYAIVVILILAALITPTGDPITLFVVALPLYALYEAAIATGKRFIRT